MKAYGTMQASRHSGIARTLLRAGRQASVSPRASMTMNFKNEHNERRPRSENVGQGFYVDHTCIDCDTCRWMQPSVYQRVNGQTAVVRQPETHEERVRALQALLSCPTNSIHAVNRQPGELREAQQGLPTPIPGVAHVFHCGWHSRKSFAATSYLIQRPAEAGGNVMVDCPRYNPVLAKQLEVMGGVSVIYLTHKDDVGDHEQWAAHFKCPRILHQDEVNSGTSGVEIKLKGAGLWKLTGEPIGAADVDNQDCVIIGTPGHTRGHTCLFYRPSNVLFSGDHLAADDDHPGELEIFTDFNWYSVDRQLDSVQLLLQYDFLHVLPGHGRMAHLRDSTHRLQAVTRLLQKHGHVANVPA